MKKMYVIKDVSTNEYWYRYDGSTGFLPVIHDAKKFNFWFDCEDKMNEYPSLFTGVYEIVPIYLKLS